MQKSALEQAFIKAAQWEDIQTLRACIEKKVDINCQQGAALEKALKFGHSMEAAQLLLEQPNITVDLIAAREQVSRIIRVAEKEHMRQVLHMLYKKGMNIERIRNTLNVQSNECLGGQLYNYNCLEEIDYLYWQGLPMFRQIFSDGLTFLKKKYVFPYTYLYSWLSADFIKKDEIVRALRTTKEAFEQHVRNPYNIDAQEIQNQKLNAKKVAQILVRYYITMGRLGCVSSCETDWKNPRIVLKELPDGDLYMPLHVAKKIAYYSI